MQLLAQGGKNEGAGLLGSTDRCQVWKSSSKTPISKHQHYKNNNKKKVEITLFLVMTNRPKQDSVFYGLFCSVKHCDGLGLPSEDLRNLFGCICQFQFNLDRERIQSISAGA